MMKFPENFLWGSATSSYQVEGDNKNADWWEWELKAGKEPSGPACRHRELYPADFDLIKRLHHNAHRLSIEWSRIEPRRGEYAQAEMDHYASVIQALRERGIEPLVTLHHFTNPIWLSNAGGWERRQTVDLFLKYTDVVVRALAKHVRYWVTINEPTIYASHAYMMGAWPPQGTSVWRAKKAYDHFVTAHVEGYRLIHRIYKELNHPAPSVSIAQHMPAIIACNNRLRNRLAVRLRDQLYNFDFFDKAIKQKTADFIGLNYYSRQMVDMQGFGPRQWLMDTCPKQHHPLSKNSLGWDIYPEGLYQVLMKLKRYRLPVYITENGICTADDDQRWDFIYHHLKNVQRAMEQGVDVRGYFYWSLMDNFEWHQGFGPRFGLIDIDYSTQRRTIRESARKYAEVCKTGVLPQETSARGD